MATDTLPTEDELLRVRSFECEHVYGHSFRVVVEDGKPRAVACDHCERKWPVFTPRSNRLRGVRR